MKRTVRYGVFETNSSSMHSLTVGDGYIFPASSLKIETIDNRVCVEFGEFGWEIKDYYDPINKLSYLLTMVAETECHGLPNKEEFYETEGFKLIDEAIADYCNCDGICIDENDISIKEWNYDGETHKYFDHEGYIDHQSCEDYKNLKDFLDYNGCDAIGFIFNEGVVLHTDNDNH